jgi:TolB-like protein
MTNERRLPIDEALRITQEVAEALGYAHEQGVIHRDVKPENILLERGHALVADFGIARITTEGATQLTQTGVTVGTPAYMSPEQASGDHDVDGRSDLYALASILYEMLAGEAPFRGPTVEALLVQRFTEAPPHLTATLATVPRHVDAAVFRAMARDPADRFPTMARFIEALSEPAEAATSRPPSSIAVLPFENMSADTENEYFSDGIAEEIINALTQIPGLHVAARTSAFSFKGKKDDLRRVAAALGVETILEGSVRKAGNRVRVTAQLISAADGYHLWSERYDRELTDIFAIQDEIARAIAGKLQLTLRDAAASSVEPPTAVIAAYEEFLKARRLVRLRGHGVHEAIPHYEEAIRLDPAYAAPHAGLALALVLLAFWGMIDPQAIGNRARSAARRAMELDPSLVDAQAAAALVALTIEADVARGVAIWDRLPPMDPGNIDAHVQRAAFDRCYIRGAHDVACAELQAAIAADPFNAYPVAQLAVVYGYARRVDAALVEAERALELDPAATFSHWALIQTHAIAGDVAATRQAFDAATARFGRGIWFLMALACSVRDQSDRSTAEAILDELTARSRTEYVQPGALGAVALAAGRRDLALTHLRHAATIPDPFFVGMARTLPFFDAIRDDPGWPAILQSIGGTDFPPPKTAVSVGARSG